MFKVGDIIECTHPSYTHLVRLIKEVYEDETYLWSYPDLEQNESNEFYSGNSTDPKLELWKLK